MLLKNFLKAGFGGAGSQVINLLALPVISRLYAPEAYAIWAIVVATSGIFGSIACFRYELAIVIPRSEEEASTIFWWCILSAGGLGLLTCLTAQTPLIEHVIARYHAGPIWFYSVFSPLLITATGISVALQYWNVRQRAFMINSFSQMILAFATFLTQFVYAIRISTTSTGLLAGSLAGQLALIILCLGGYKNIKRPQLNGRILLNIPNMLYKHHRFLFYSMPYTLFGMLRNRGSLLVMDYFLANREVGLYAFAYRIMNFPVSLISSALRPVLFKETAEKGTRALEGQINQILKIITILGTPVVVVYFFYAEDIFRLFFGEKWTDSGMMGRFIILPVFTFMLCNWMDRIMDVLGQQRLVLMLEIYFASASIIALWLGFVLHGGLYVALLLQCAILISYNICYLVIAYDKAGYNKKYLAHLAAIVCSLAIPTIVTIAAIR